jgi:hypothetical protein
MRRRLPTAESTMTFHFRVRPLFSCPFIGSDSPLMRGAGKHSWEDRLFIFSQFKLWLVATGFLLCSFPAFGWGAWNGALRRP